MRTVRVDRGALEAAIRAGRPRWRPWTLDLGTGAVRHGGGGLPLPCLYPEGPASAARLLRAWATQTGRHGAAAALEAGWHVDCVVGWLDPGARASWAAFLDRRVALLAEGALAEAGRRAGARYRAS